jgi:hypothetical protein
MDNISITVIPNVSTVNITANNSINSVQISVNNGQGGGLAAIGNSLSSNAFTSGSVIFSGVNATINTSLNAQSQYIQISVANAVAGAAIQGSGTFTQNTGTIQFSNANGLSFGLTNGTMTASHNALTTAMASNQTSNFRYTSADNQLQFTSANSNFLGTGATASLVFTSQSSLFQHTSATSNITSNAFEASATTKFAGTGTSATNASITLNSNGLQISIANPGGGGGIAASLSGNSTSAGAGYSNITSGTMILAGGNNITLSQNGASITISGANAGGAQTGISGVVASNTTYSSGTVIYSAQTNITIGTSVNGVSQYVRFSVGDYLTTAMQSNANTSFIGLNSAVTNITATINSSGISISNPGWLTTAVQSNQTSNFRFTSADSQLQFISANTNFATYNHSHGNPTLNLTNISGTTASASNGLTISLSAAAPGGGAGIAGSIGGNSTSAGAGYSNITSGTMILAGGNNITLSQNGANITISGANAGGAQTGISGFAGSNTTYSSGTVILSALNNITISSSINGASQYLQLSVGNYITTGMASNEPHIGALVFSNETQTSGTVVFTGSGGISIASGAGSVIISFDGHHIDAVLPSGNGFGTGFSSMTSGTMNINAMGALSMSQNGNNLSLSVPSNYLTTAMASNANTSFVGLNSALTANGVSATINSSGVSLNFPTFLTTAMASANTSLYMSTSERNNYQYTSNSSNNTSVYLSIGNSTAYQTSVLSGTFFQTVNSSNLFPNANTTIFAGTGTSATNASITLNSNGLAVSVAAPGAAAEANWINLQGNTASNSTASGSTIMWSAGNNITLAATNGSVIRIDAGGGGGAVLQGSGTYTQNTGTVQFSNANNVSFGLTAGTMTASIPVGTVAFADSNGVTFGSSVNGVSTTITASVNAGAGGGIALAGSAASTVTSGTVQFSNANNISFGLNGSTMTASYSDPPSMSFYQNMDFVGVTQTMNLSSNSWVIFPFRIREGVSASYIRLLMSAGVAASTTNATVANTSFTANCSQTFFAVLYSQGNGANSRSLQYITSASAGISQSWSMSFDAVNGSNYTLHQAMTIPTEHGTSFTNFAQTIQTTATNISMSQSWSSALTGGKFLDLPFEAQLTERRYWMALGRSITSNTNYSIGTRWLSVSHAMSYIAVSQPNLAFGQAGRATNATNNSWILNQGLWTTNAQGTTNSINLAQVSTSASHNIPVFQLKREA